MPEEVWTLMWENRVVRKLQILGQILCFFHGGSYSIAVRHSHWIGLDH